MAANVTTPGAVQPKMWLGGIEPMKASYGKLMMWFFLISDTFTFSALLVAYGTARFSFPAFEGEHADFTFSNMYWPVPERVYEAVPFLHGISLPLVFVGIMTFILIASSVTMVLAVEAGHRMDRAGVEKYMLWTILGGFTFLGCQAWEWSHFIHGTDAGSVMKVIQNGEWVEKTVFGANLTENQYGPPASQAFTERTYLAVLSSIF
jgi:cytochrome c oxidase subunit III